MALEIAPLTQADRAAWDALARGYKLFYKTPVSDAELDLAWTRLLAADEVYALGACLDGQLVGMAHYLFHTSVWAPRVCYLQDMFTLPAVRGRGVGRALIEAVATEAKTRGAERFYWLTQESNVVARSLYDKLARYGGFIRYEFPMQRA